MKHLYYILISALFLTSCMVPGVVTQITPEAPEGHYEMGREYISLSNDSIDVELGYDGIHGEHLVFDFVVINKTPQVLTVNPSDFYYVVLDSATADSSKFPPRMAVHPERILHHYDETLESKKGAKSMNYARAFPAACGGVSEHNKNRQSIDDSSRLAARRVNSFLGFMEAGVGLLANTTAFIATDNPGYLVDALFGTLGTAEIYVAQDKQISADISMVYSEKEIVNEEIFRLGQLPPGKVVSGYVYFPKHPDTDYYMFCFPVQDQLFQFVYNQRKVYHYY